MTTNASRCGSRQTFSSATSSPNSNRCRSSNEVLERCGLTPLAVGTQRSRRSQSLNSINIFFAFATLGCHHADASRTRVDSFFGFNNSPPRKEIPLRSPAGAPSSHLGSCFSPRRFSGLDRKQCVARESKIRRIAEYLVEWAGESRVYHRSILLCHNRRSG